MTWLAIVLASVGVTITALAVHVRGLPHSEEYRFRQLLRSDDPSALWRQPVDRKGRMR